jgi:hypothetical protein
MLQHEGHREFLEHRAWLFLPKDRIPLTCLADYFPRAGWTARTSNVAACLGSGTFGLCQQPQTSKHMNHMVVHACIQFHAHWITCVSDPNAKPASCIISRTCENKPKHNNPRKSHNFLTETQTTQTINQIHTSSGGSPSEATRTSFAPHTGQSLSRPRQASHRKSPAQNNSKQTQS